MNTLTLVLILIAVAAVAFAAFMYIQRRRTLLLRNRFGPEYDRVVKTRGDQHKAEEELARRQRRIEKLNIRDLNHDEIDRFSGSWRSVQAEFVDTPRQAVEHADQLVQEVMTARGYPMADFDQRAADISVDHPVVVEHYRGAHDIAVRDRAGEANTEDLRQAMVHYRDLFQDLLSPSRTHLSDRARTDYDHIHHEQEVTR